MYIPFDASTIYTVEMTPSQATTDTPLPIMPPPIMHTPPTHPRSPQDPTHPHSPTFKTFNLPRPIDPPTTTIRSLPFHSHTLPYLPSSYPTLTTMLLPLLLPLLAALPRPSTALPCAIFDASDALYLFGTGPSHATDLALGASPSSWSSQTTTLSAQGDRPPFDAENTQCFLNQYKDGLVVLFADQANPSVRLPPD